jgi:hypothetical protein
MKNVRRNPLVIAGAVLFFFATCAFAKAPPPPKLPEWKAIPASVLDAFCANFREEGISSSTTINVVKTAQKMLITPASMQALSDSGFYHGSMDSAKAASVALASSDEIPVTMPNDCAWRPIEPKSGARFTDTMTLEISPPIANPFSRNSTGIFARLTLGGEASTWYWLPLIPRGEMWTAGRMAVLPYRQ